MSVLLAVDLGLRTGLAAYGEDGRLKWYRSSNFGNRARLKRGAWSVVHEISGLHWVYLEGDRALAEVWAKVAEKHGAETRLVSPERWRGALMDQKDRRSGKIAKETADRLARRVIEWSGVDRPTSLRHDAAEAVLLGLYAVREVGWLSTLPPEVR